MVGRRALVALVLSAGLLAGCSDGSSSDGSGDDPSSDHNSADVTFATEMIQHHAQALAMVDLSVGRPLDPEVQAVVDGVRAAQAPEIEAMVDWLTTWDEPVPATVNDHLNADGHGGHDDTGLDMPGMMSVERMAELDAASDTEFPGLWLTMMVEHHEGAVEMARAQLDAGKYAPALDLAAAIEEGQSAEIDTMEALLSGGAS